MLAFYADNIAVETHAFDGCLAALDTLAQRGARIAIVTNKAEHLARKLLDTLGHSSRFACVIGGDTLGPGNAKPSPAPIHEMIARCGGGRARSEEHTSELQSLMRNSYAVFCLKKKHTTTQYKKLQHV